MDVPAKIRYYRMKKNYSQHYMAEALNISQSYYNKLENGQAKLTVDNLLDISGILNVSPSELLNETRDYFNEISVSNGQVGSGNTLHISYSEEERNLYIKTIELLKEEISYLKKILDKIK